MKLRLPLLVMVFLACGRPSTGDGPSPVSSTTVAPTPDAAATPKEARAVDAVCPPMDPAKVAPFVCDRTLVDVAIPPIIDAKHTMAPFYEKVAELARGRAKRHVRIAMYGDSNLTADAASGRMRRQLQQRFGDGGHGWVALARPWEWYSHNDVHHDGNWKLWKQIATSTNKIPDGHYGFANIAAESATPGAMAWVSTEPQPGAPIGFTANRFDVYYLKRPGGGTFDLMLDGEVKKTIDTKADAFEAAYETIETTDAKHEVRVKVQGHGLVRVFGVAIERDPPSIQYDCLGTGSFNIEQMASVKSDTRKAQLEHRPFDLVIIQLGTNEFGNEDVHRKQHKQVIDEFRSVLPNLPFLLLAPPDEVEIGTTYSDPRIVSLGKRLKSIAADDDAAFWDFREAMGGDKSILTFMHKTLAYKDQVHLSKQGHEVMGDRILCALFTDMKTHLDTHPDAGCGATDRDR